MCLIPKNTCMLKRLLTNYISDCVAIGTQREASTQEVKSFMITIIIVTVRRTPNNAVIPNQKHGAYTQPTPFV